LFSKLTFKLFSATLALVCSVVLSVFLLAAKTTASEQSQTQATTFNTSIPALAATITVDPTRPATTTIAPSIASAKQMMAPAQAPTIGPSSIKSGKVEALLPSVYTPQHLLLAGLPATVYVPAGLPVAQPVQVLVALHGMHSNGGSFCQGLVSFSEQNHTILIAPTFDYNPDYTNAQIIASEDIQLTTKISQMVKEFGTASHLHLKSQLLIYGFSRGAQLAHHFAMLYPKQTLGVTVFSGGAYTLPFINMGGPHNQTLVWPIGIGDLSEYTNGKPFDEASFVKIPFNIEVGGDDNKSGDVSRAWDSYLGTNRLERGQNYYHALQQLGMNVQFTVFPKTDHTVSPAMNQTALKFMQSLLVAQVAA